MDGECLKMLQAPSLIPQWQPGPKTSSSTPKPPPRGPPPYR